MLEFSPSESLGYAVGLGYEVVGRVASVAGPFKTGAIIGDYTNNTDEPSDKWLFDPEPIRSDNYLYNATDLRQIADKLDELNGVKNGV